jgi:hypothetical protein
VQRHQGGDRQPASGALPGDGDGLGGKSLRQQEAVTRDRVVQRRWKGVLGRKPVAERQRARPRLAPGLRYHVTVTVDRSGDVAAAVQE